MAARVLYFLRWSASMWLRTTRHGVKTKFVWGASLEDNEVGKLVYEDFLPAALRDGVFVPAPEFHVIGADLGAIQDGLDMLKKGVSASKLVVLLDAAEGRGLIRMLLFPEMRRRSNACGRSRDIYWLEGCVGPFCIRESN